jgi:hypothetical protein
MSSLHSIWNETLPTEIIKAALAGDRESTDRGRLQVLDALAALD